MDRDTLDEKGTERPTDSTVQRPAPPGDTPEKTAPGEDGAPRGGSSKNKVDVPEEVAEERFGCCGPQWGRKEVGLVAMMALVELSVQSFMSLLGPFYATRAHEKGVGATAVGYIFGIVPLVSLLLSPIYGVYVREIGVKFLLVTGTISVGCCSLLFGFIDWVENRVAYMVLCCLVRGLDGACQAAAFTAVYVVLAQRFPNDLASTSAVMEATAAIGYTIGAPIGGALNEIGGFMVPFVVCGCLIVLVGVLLWVTAPSLKCDDVALQSCWGLLLCPNVALALLNLVIGLSALGFLISRMGVHVAQLFRASPVQVSAVYFTNAVSYLLGTAFWGVVAEKLPTAGPAVYSIGYLGTAVGLFFLGPAPFLHLPRSIYLLLLPSAFVHFGLAAGLVAFQIVGIEARQTYGMSLQISGWVGGILNTSFALGEFIGPVTAGYMEDLVGFEWSCVATSGAFFLGATAQLSVYLFRLYHQRIKPSNDEGQALLNMASFATPQYTVGTEDKHK